MSKVLEWQRARRLSGARPREACRQSARPEGRALAGQRRKGKVVVVDDDLEDIANRHAGDLDDLVDPDDENESQP